MTSEEVHSIASSSVPSSSVGGKLKRQCSRDIWVAKVRKRKLAREAALKKEKAVAEVSPMSEDAGLGTDERVCHLSTSPIRRAALSAYLSEEDTPTKKRAHRKSSRELDGKGRNSHQNEN